METCVRKITSLDVSLNASGTDMAGNRTAVVLADRRTSALRNVHANVSRFGALSDIGQ